MVKEWQLLLSLGNGDNFNPTFLREKNAYQMSSSYEVNAVL